MQQSTGREAKTTMKNCMQVYMQPSGFLSMNGIAATTPFLKRLMERLNVRPLFFRREAYKNVVNQFTHVRQFSHSPLRP